MELRLRLPHRKWKEILRQAEPWQGYQHVQRGGARLAGFVWYRFVLRTKPTRFKQMLPAPVDFASDRCNTVLKYAMQTQNQCVFPRSTILAICHLCQKVRVITAQIATLQHIPHTVSSRASTCTKSS